jgi:hypothetical protein
VLLIPAGLSFVVGARVLRNARTKESASESR